jgi:parallel beta-helix repeat protein
MIYKKFNISKKNVLTITCLSVIVLFTSANGFLYLMDPFLSSDKSVKESEPKTSDFWNFVGTTISIDNNWTTTNSTYDWCNGAGTVGDPYFIENVTIDAQNSGSCIYIQNSNDYFIIRNCTLIDGGGLSLDSGIYLYNVQNGLIQNNTCYDARCGIVVETSSDIIVRENIVYGSSFVGIYMMFGSNNDAINNKITGSNRGLSIYSASNMNFSQNVMENTGIHVYYNAESQLPSNYIDTSNLVSGKPVYFYANEDNLDNSNFTDPGQIILASCNDVSLSGFDLKNTNVGMQLLFCDNAQVFGNNFTDNSDAGIFLREGSFNNFSNNYFESNMYGINLYDTCRNNTIDNNTLLYGSYGVFANIDSDNNIIVNNNFTQCSRGIQISSSDNNIIESNDIIDSTGYGLYLYFTSSNNHFIRNTIEGANLCGIYFDNNIDSNEFRENIIKDSGTAGAYIPSGCENNIFVQNSFIQNTLHVNDVGTDNYYNNSIIGNYWDNYTGVDADDDGIGDTAHLVQTSTTIYDYFPIWNDGFDVPIPIHVNNNWSETVVTYDWVSGSGTWGDPYVIEDITIDAQGSGSGILIENTDEYFIIRNCTIYDVPDSYSVSTGYNAGIRLYDTNNGMIYNNTIYDTEYAGISLYNADNNTIYENILYQNVLWGIDNHWSSYNQIINNTVSANFVDIGFYNCENMTLRDNQMLLSGFYFRASNLLQANSHYIPLSNTLNGKTLYYYKNQNYLSFTAFQNPAQIILVNCHNSSISDIEFSHAYRPIDLYYSDDNIIQNCNFTSNNDKSIQLIYSGDNIIQNNRFGDGDSVVIDNYSSNNKVRYNEFLGSGNSITVLDHSSYNQIYDNEIDGGSRGVYLVSYATSNVIFRNNISNLWFYGVYIMGYSSLNHVYDNTITDCDREGIRVERSDSNMIRENRIISNELGILLYSDSGLNGCYNNTLLSNVKHAQDDGVNNFWNITTIGNYWDNYTGVDADDNFIGDIAHPITGSSASFDYLPIWEDGDDLGPIISITSPSIDSYHINPPTIQVSITDIGEVNETWYTIIGSGINHTFTGTSFEVDTTSWTNHVDGPIIIRTYANDTYGNLAFADLSVNKDTTNPEILINEPLIGTEFGDEPPSFNLTINESNIFQFWFKINDSSTSQFISVVSGNNVFAMDSSIWDAIPDGHVLISFYMNDTVGNSGTISVTIIKDTSTSPPPGSPPGIPGYGLGLLIGIVSIISVISIAKRRKLLD